MNDLAKIIGCLLFAILFFGTAIYWATLDWTECRTVHSWGYCARHLGR